VYLGPKKLDCIQKRASRCGGGVSEGSTQILALDEAQGAFFYLFFRRLDSLSNSLH